MYDFVYIFMDKNRWNIAKLNFSQKHKLLNEIWPIFLKCAKYEDDFPRNKACSFFIWFLRKYYFTIYLTNVCSSLNNFEHYNVERFMKNVWFCVHFDRKKYMNKNAKALKIHSVIWLIILRLCILFQQLN